VTWARVWFFAVGTLVSIDPDTSKTASTRPGTVIAAQRPSDWLIALASRPAAAVPPFAPAVAGGETLFAPIGSANPAPTLPSALRRPAVARAFLKLGFCSI
jgi:hypothetical protein